MICFASRYIPVYTDVREAKQWEKNSWSSSLIPEGSYIANRVVISFETVCYTSFWKRKKTKIIKFSLFLSLTRSRLCIVIIKQRDSKQIPYCDFQLDLCFPLILPVFSYARRTVIQQNGFSTIFLLSLWPSLIPIGRIIIYTWENCLKENFGVYVSELIDKKVVGNYSNESGNER